MTTTMTTTKTTTPDTTKIIIATGYDGSERLDHVELLDLETNTGKRCTNYPLKVGWATGGLIGSSPLICGGESPRTDACYIIGQQETVVVTMTTPRSYASSIVFNGRL